MKYLDSNGLQKLRDADSERMNRLYKPIECGLWTKSEKRQIIGICPVANTELKTTLDFHFTEIFPTEGVKGVNNPSHITGVSNVVIGHLGKNIPALTTLKAHDGSGLLCESANEDGSFRIYGTVDANYAEGFINLNDPNTDLCPKCLIPGETYTVSFYTQGNDPGLVLALFPRLTDNHFLTSRFRIKNKQSATFTWVEDSPRAWYRVQTTTGKTADAIVKAQIELGTEATEYEPALRTNYETTISLGNTYYGGTIDVSSGIMTVTYNGKVFTGNEDWVDGADGDYYCYYTIISPVALSGDALGKVYTTERCSHFTVLNHTKLTEQHIIAYGNKIAVYATQTTLEAFKSWLSEQYNAGTPVTIAYPVKPYTVQLTPYPMNALPQVDKYSPRVNTIYSSVGNLQVEYLKSPVRSSYEIQQAILAQGGV